MKRRMVSLSGGNVIPAELAICFGAQMLLCAVCCACSSRTSLMKGYLEWRMSPVYSYSLEPVSGMGQWYDYWSRKTALNKGKFHCCGFCLP